MRTTTSIIIAGALIALAIMGNGELNRTTYSAEFVRCVEAMQIIYPTRYAEQRTLDCIQRKRSVNGTLFD